MKLQALAFHVLLLKIPSRLWCICYVLGFVWIFHVKQAQTADEKALISQTVKTLIHELERELGDIQHLTGLHSNYAERCVTLRLWLTDKPNVEELQASMQRIKLLKSKLRHLLADRADAQEVAHSMFYKHLNLMFNYGVVGQHWRLWSQSN